MSYWMEAYEKAVAIEKEVRAKPITVTMDGYEPTLAALEAIRQYKSACYEAANDDAHEVLHHPKVRLVSAALETYASDYYSKDRTQWNFTFQIEE